MAALSFIQLLHGLRRAGCSAGIELTQKLEIVQRTFNLFGFSYTNTNRRCSARWVHRDRMIQDETRCNYQAGGR